MPGTCLAPEVLHGGKGDDYLIGSSLGDVLAGGAGYDVLQGGDGDDMYLFERGSGTEYVDDSAGGRDVVTTARSVYDVTQFSASGNNQVLTFNDGSQLVLVNGRAGLGVEAVEFDDYAYTREDISAILDYLSSGGGSYYGQVSTDTTMLMAHNIV